jgi:hypothetical protein
MKRKHEKMGEKSIFFETDNMNRLKLTAQFPCAQIPRHEDVG